MKQIFQKDLQDGGYYVQLFRSYSRKEFILFKYTPADMDYCEIVSVLSNCDDISNGDFIALGLNMSNSTLFMLTEDELLNMMVDII